MAHSLSKEFANVLSTTVYKYFRHMALWDWPVIEGDNQYILGCLFGSCDGLS